MYSINLEKISLDEFKKILTTVQLLPSQKRILNNIEENFKRLEEKGFTNLNQIHHYLKNKKDYPTIEQDTGIDEVYLKILNRMVNSYIVKILPLTKLDVFSDAELSFLSKKRITNTQHYYEYFLKAILEDDFSENIGLESDKAEYAFRIIDLLRINGVGVDYAKILHKMGIKSVSDYKKTPSTEILKRYKALNDTNNYSKATLGVSDIEYCRRFCNQLDSDIK